MSGSANPTSITMSGNRSVSATFSVVEPGPHTLSVSKSGSGSGVVSSSPSGISCGSTCSAEFAHGTSVTLSASASSGSVFAGWSGCQSTSGSQCTVSMSQARSVTATFNLAPLPPTSVTNQSIMSPYSPVYYSSTAMPTSWDAGSVGAVGPSAETYQWVRVAWNASPSSGVTGYRVFRKACPTCTPTQVASVGSTIRRFDHETSVGSSFYYGVASVTTSGAGEIAWDSTPTAALFSRPVLTSPMDKTTTSTTFSSGSNVSFTWTPPSTSCGSSVRLIEYEIRHLTRIIHER